MSYQIPIPDGADLADLTIRATVYSQAIQPFWPHQRFTLAPDGPATKRLYYLASHLNTKGTAIEDWKLRLVSSEARVGG